MSFSDEALEKCWQHDDCKKISPNLKRRILMKLDLMDAATCLKDLKSPPGNHLHPLQGEVYRGYWAISVNGPWRLVFLPYAGNIYNVRLEQYH